MAQLAGAFAAATVLLSGCGGGVGPTTITTTATTAITTITIATTTAADEGQSIAELAELTENLSTLVTALSAANLTSVFEGTDEHTVFAPTNNAFANMDETLLGCLLAPVGKASLQEVLEYHVLEGSAMSANLTNNEELTTLEGQELNVSIAGKKVMVGNATIVQKDIMANNGVVHEIDAVLVPSKVSKRPPQCGTGTIAHTAAALNNPEAPELTTLVAALTAVDLVEAVNSTTGDLLTVFAPSDNAFAALPKGMLPCLLKPANKDALASILEFHVVPQYLLAAQIRNEKVDTLLKGNQLTFAVKQARGNWHIDVNSIEATVIQADVFATNGVVHVIDTVLLPETNWTNPCASIEHEDEIQV